MVPDHGPNHFLPAVLFRGTKTVTKNKTIFIKTLDRCFTWNIRINRDSRTTAQGDLVRKRAPLGRISCFTHGGGSTRSYHALCPELDDNKGGCYNLDDSLEEL
jgi:hypothetical protein